MKVLLLHGLNRTPLSMRWLGRALRHAGHTPHSFGYLPSAESYGRIVSRLVRRVDALTEDGTPYAAVGHSLGGLLLRDAIARSGRRPSHLIMLGTPNRPPRLAAKAVAVGAFRWFSGECGRRLVSPEFFAELPAPDYPYTIIAGTRGLYGRLSPFGADLNDGIVAVDETRLQAEGEVITLPVAHTFMMNSQAARELILAAVSRAA